MSRSGLDCVLRLRGRVTRLDRLRLDNVRMARVRAGFGVARGEGLVDELRRWNGHLRWRGHRRGVRFEVDWWRA